MNSSHTPIRFTLLLVFAALVATLSLVASYRMSALDITGAAAQAMQEEMLRDNAPIVD